MSLKIIGAGKYLPKTCMLSSEIDAKLKKKLGFVEENYFIARRYFADENETTSFMAAQAAIEAINNSELEISDIDCIISASAIMEQALPGTAPLIQKKIGLSDSGCTTLDVNSSCLSFLSALDIANLYLKSNRFKNILIVSSDIASIGLNWSEPSICTNFGDGAAAIIVSATKETKGIISSQFKTFSEGYETCQIKAGGTRLHPSRFKEDLLPHALFEMNGKEAFKINHKIIDSFMIKLFETSNLTINDIDLFIPHQASAAALSYFRRKFNIPPEKMIDIYSTHGNQVAASLPSALYEAISSKRLIRGQKAVLFGTAAGLSIGGIILEY